MSVILPLIDEETSSIRITKYIPYPDYATEIGYLTSAACELFISGSCDEMYPYQQKIAAMCPVYEDRIINVIYDPEERLDKSALVEWLECENMACVIPSSGHAQDIMARVMDQRSVHKAYFVDIPPAMMDEDKVCEFYSVIETLKNGSAYDKRDRFRKIRFDRPQVFLFTNSLPDFNMLARDRWRIMRVTQDRDLKIIRPQDENVSGCTCK